MPEGGLTSASSLRCLTDKTGGRNNFNEQESNAVHEHSRLDLDEPVPGFEQFEPEHVKRNIEFPQLLNGAAHAP